MRLEATGKYLLKIKLIKRILFFVGFLFFASINSKSQNYFQTFSENTTLSEALLQSSRLYKFRVAFDAKRLGSIYADKLVKGNSQDEYITCLLKNSGFTFLYKHGSYLIVEASPTNVKQNISNEINGLVVDEETGEQLPFVSVIIPEENIFTSTTSNGTFSVKNIISNPIHIIISYIGFYEIDTLIPRALTSIDHSFKMKRKMNMIDSISISGEKLEVVDCRSNIDLSTVINPVKLIDLPIVAETDIFRTLQLLPGINYSENSSELSIRGGTSDQNLVLFDGQTLYNLSHFYGVFSSINPNIIKDIQVFKGGFDSRYGERISGIVDITGKSGNQMKPSLIAGINLLSANLAIEIPLSKKLTIITAARRSYSDIYSTSFARNLFETKIPVSGHDPNQIVSISEPKFYFYDFNVKMNYRIDNKENISFSVYGGKDYFNNTYEVSTQSIYVANADSNVIYNFGASALWQKQWSNSFFSTILVGSSGFSNEANNSTNINRLISDGPEEPFLPDSQNIFKIWNKNDLNDYFISNQNSWSINNYNQINFGCLIRYNSIFYRKDVDQIYIYDNIRQSAWLSSVFIQDKIRLFKNMSLKPGIRISYYGGDRKLYVEPRFAAKIDLSDNLSLHLATGRYFQFISQVTSTQETSYNKNFWTLANDSVNPVLKSNHYIFGATVEHKNILIDAEAYYKINNGIQEYIYLSQFTKNTEFDFYFPPKDNGGQMEPPTPQPSCFIVGSGKTFGIDFFIRYKSKHFTSWISYTLSKSSQQFDMINSGSEIPALTDQTHQFSYSNLFTFGRWNIGTLALFSTGKPYISFSENKDILPITRTYSRMPDFFRMDVSMNYNFQIRTARFKTGVTLINLFNTSNYFDSNVRTFNFESSKFSETNLIQSQKLSLNVFLQIAI